MFEQVQTDRNSTQETLDDVLADYRLRDSEREAIRHAASEVLGNLPQSEVAQFLTDLRTRIEAAREPAVHSHVQDISAATKALARMAANGGKGRLDYFSYNFPPDSVTNLVEDLAA